MVDTTPTAEPLMTPSELAKYLQLPLNTVYLHSSRGTGPKALRVGRHLRYRMADVQNWLEGQAKPA